MITARTAVAAASTSKHLCACNAYALQRGHFILAAVFRTNYATNMPHKKALKDVYSNNGVDESAG